MEAERESRRRHHHRQKRPRRRRHSSSSDEEEDAGFSTWKTAAVFGIIGICFAVLYPKMFHPMLMYVIYGSKSTDDDAKQQYPHPSMPRGRAPPPMSGGARGGPPPGMGQFAKEGGGTSSSGRGWHWMLPFYTIGVIVFLLYTLSKIIWKKPKRGRQAKYPLRYSTKNDRFEIPGATESESDDDDGLHYPGRLKKRELKGLQRRLVDTESAMSKILGQLEQLSGNVDDATASAIRESTMETLNNLAQTQEKAKNLKTETETREPKEERQSESASRSQSDTGSSESEPEEKPRRGRRSKKAATEEYLGDLEKALQDFRSLTESYVQQKATEAMQKALSEEIAQKQAEKDGTAVDEKPKAGSECEDHHDAGEGPSGVNDAKDNDSEERSESEEPGFDAMTGEDITQPLPEPVGEIVDLNEKNEQSGVRKRH